MRSDVLRAAIESELEAHKDKLIQLRGKLQKAVDNLDVSGWIYSHHVGVCDIQIRYYNIYIYIYIYIYYKEVSWSILINHLESLLWVHDSWNCNFDIFRLPCAKAASLPDLITAANATESDFTDFLSRVNLKWRDHGNPRKSGRFDVVWNMLCCLATFFSKSDETGVFYQGGLHVKHVASLQFKFQVGITWFNTYINKNMINHIWYVFWNPCVEASLITPFWMM